jgi:hypothetical protein
MCTLLGSDLIHLNLLGTHVVVLNTAQAAAELLDKKSSIYSDRCAQGAVHISFKPNDFASYSPWLTMIDEL